MHGAGNDFIVVDEWDKEVVPEKHKSLFVSKISDRHFGVGCDGVIFVKKSGREDARLHFFNPDGSLAEMCGNGIRCLAEYLYESERVRKPEMRVETRVGTKTIRLLVEGNRVVKARVDMGRPQIKRKEAQVSGKPDGLFVNEEVEINGSRLRLTAVGMGNPHVIIFTDDIEGVDVFGLGSKIRNYRKLFPNGINVNFVKHIGRNEFKIRTYERGVEGETLACGTGICASAVAAVLNKKASPNRPLIFHAKGGDLTIEFDLAGDKISSVYLTGPVVKVFDGSYEFKPD